MEKFNQFIDDLSKLISYPSVKSAPDGDMPFGKNVYGAYKFMMDLATAFGFETINYDNYIGEAVYGEGEELGIIGHVDVVPAGSGWESDPFVLTRRGDTYYARGVQDDKAPLLLCLYALKELKDSGVKCNRKIRFIVGCDEESGWADIDYFKTKSKFPVYGFSPDGNFPVSYAEKGINKIVFTIPKLKRFTILSGGTVCNAVCGYASAKATADAIDCEKLKKYGLTVNDEGVIESVGKSCHGSRPELGINAIKPLFQYFAEMGEDTENIVEYLFNDKLDLTKNQTEQGGVTFSPNIVEEKDGKIVISCDCRVPAPLKLEDIIPTFDKFGIEYKAFKKRDALLVPKDSKFVSTLLNAYNSVTGEKGEPISQRGGTFAYVFGQGCAFGPEFEGEDSSIHEPNERITEKGIIRLYEIYKKAIFDLVK